MFADYDSTIFQQLDHILDARDGASPHLPVIDELGEVFVGHRVHDSVGVSLLHRHFDLSPDERLLETIEGNSIYMQPRSWVSADDLVPYMWKLVQHPASGDWRWMPLEFAVKQDQPCATQLYAALSKRRSDFLPELARRLVELNLADVFGISTLHREALGSAFVMSDDTIALETTNEAGRVSRISVVPKAGVDFKSTIQTLWVFEAGDHGAWCAGCCKNHCSGYCRGYCKHEPNP